MGFIWGLYGGRPAFMAYPDSFYGGYMGFMGGYGGLSSLYGVYMGVLQLYEGF